MSSFAFEWGNCGSEGSGDFAMASVAGLAGVRAIEGDWFFDEGISVLGLFDVVVKFVQSWVPVAQICLASGDFFCFALVYYFANSLVLEYLSLTLLLYFLLVESSLYRL